MVAKRWREGMGVQGCGGRDVGRIEGRDGKAGMGAQGWGWEGRDEGTGWGQKDGGRDGGRIEGRDGGTELREGMGGRMGAQGW